MADSKGGDAFLSPESALGARDDAAFSTSADRAATSMSAYSDTESRFEASSISTAEKGSEFVSARLRSEGPLAESSPAGQTSPDGAHNGPGDAFVGKGAGDPGAAFMGASERGAASAAPLEGTGGADGYRGFFNRERIADAALRDVAANMGEHETLAGSASRQTAEGALAARDAFKALKGKGGNFKRGGAAAASFMAAADEEGEIGEAERLVRKGRNALGAAKAIREKVSKKGGPAGKDIKKAYSQGKSRAIAKALNDGSLSGGMSPSQRLRALLSALGGAASSGAASVGRGFAPILAGGAAAVAPLALIFLFVILIMMAITGGGDQTDYDMTPTESQVADFFRSKDLEDIQIAAIMGNMKAESGMDPAKRQSDGGAIGICQWDGGRKLSLVSFAAERGVHWTDLSLQLEFFWDHDIWHTEWMGSYQLGYYDYPNPSPAMGSWVRGSKSQFLSAKTVEDATRQFCYGWERPGFPRINERIKHASNYLTALRGGQDLADAKELQRKVVDKTYSTPSPGGGLCAMWVSQVFQAAGLGYPGGNADDMFYAWCKSTDRSELKVGMIVATPTHPHTSAGQIYGHVAIYIGGGKVRDNVGDIREMELQDWIDYYDDTHVVKWGWVNGRDLSQ